MPEYREHKQLIKKNTKVAKSELQTRLVTLASVPNSSKSIMFLLVPCDGRSPSLIPNFSIHVSDSK